LDVLHLIKQEHEGIRSLLQELSKEKTVTAQKKVLQDLLHRAKIHMHVEHEYLYPEVTGLFNEAENFIKNSKENHKTIKKTLTELEKLVNSKPMAAKPAVEKKVSHLMERFQAHFTSGEDVLMPKLRELIPTQDREDLGQVFLDAQEEGAALVSVQLTNPNGSHKKKAAKPSKRRVS
jgi:hypothetical protein